MRQVYKEAFTIYGITVRTSNKKEMNPDEARIGALWQEFFTICDKNKIQPENAFGVYSEYESDWQGEFNVSAGLMQDYDEKKTQAIHIPSGNYLHFEKTGPMPATAITLWQEVWEQFARSDAPKRLYGCDFEEYTGTDKVSIYIGIEESHG